ncbi:MAG: hypothetical protein KBB54_01490 [Candidatus Pacebacteria bacterium]|nr:hypothetical protein [Candidatus Paceibacterota bacterium]MBP9819003.1 hypothetical protein [Candidatus Paceibacterota bacterium]
MADKKPDKKGPPKPSGGGGGSAEGQMVFMALIATVVVFVIIPTVLIFFGYSKSSNIIPSDLGDKTSAAFTGTVDTLGLISIFISLLFVMGLIYAKTRRTEIADAYSAHLAARDNIGKPKPLQSSLASNIAVSNAALGDTVLGAEGVAGVNIPVAPIQSPAQATLSVASSQGGNTALNPFEQYMQNLGQKSSSAVNHGQRQEAVAPEAQVTNPRWAQIEKNMQSHNMSEWRVAILEADILLYDMLSQMGYEGTSIGEILKNVDKANFVTLDDAWKAHRIRNIIAHEGANYELSRDEAERTIRLFKRVFDEFYFV